MSRFVRKIYFAQASIYYNLLNISIEIKFSSNMDYQMTRINHYVKLITN